MALFFVYCYMMLVMSHEMELFRRKPSHIMNKKNIITNIQKSACESLFFQFYWHTMYNFFTWQLLFLYFCSSSSFFSLSFCRLDWNTNISFFENSFSSFGLYQIFEPAPLKSCERWIDLDTKDLDRESICAMDTAVRKHSLD